MGRLEAQDVAVPLRGAPHLRIEKLALDGTGNRVSGKATVHTVEGTSLQLQGHVEQSSRALNVDLDLAAGSLDWNAIAPWISRGEAATGPGASASWGQSLRGKVRVVAESFSYGGFTWEPLRAVVAFAPGVATVTVSNAAVPAASRRREQSR